MLPLPDFIMKHYPPEGPSKFTGSMRHYHRSGKDSQRTWDDWVAGGVAKRRNSKKWLKISGLILGMLTVAGIIVGIIIEIA